MSAVASPMRAAATLGDRILKVDHAGEHGAVGIYRGQIVMARWRAPGDVAQLREFLEHELGHRARFAALLAARGRPRCRSYHLCGLGGWTLGLVTGVLGRSAIAATTHAVESVVLVHLREQLAVLEGVDPEARSAIAAIVDEETGHHDAAAEQYSARDFWPRVLTPLVRVSTETVIWLGMRL